MPSREPNGVPYGFGCVQRKNMILTNWVAVKELTLSYHNRNM